MPFIPQKIFFEAETLDYPIARRIWDAFKSNSRIEISMLKAKQRIPNSKGVSLGESYRLAKKVLVVGIRKTLDFQSCKPSAHYQLPLVTGCMGQCEYCYLNTQFGKNPYIRVYVNLDEILDRAAQYIDERQADLTLFEGAATSDPVPVEPYTGSLAQTIQFFARQEHARFRFVSKFTDVESLLSLEHQGRTTIRFSINADHIIKNFEHFTPGLANRLQAAGQIARAGYPFGFIIGPVMLFEGWEKEYQQMFDHIIESLKGYQQSNFSFEIISHRFTTRAKNTILTIHPDSSLPMDENLRKYKYGQFGYGKYVYEAEEMKSIQNFFRERIGVNFPESHIDYII